ncbi:MAG TPA: hypothetical protein VK184_13640 [Nostocaceae cyanobacterium]|nr:hypothetical protein [Nostocaceae cyanobacterium]
MQLLLQEQTQISQVLSQIIAQAWCDSSYEQEFLNNPKIKFAEAGIHFPEEVELQVKPTNHSNSLNETLFEQFTHPSGKVTYTIPFAAKPTEIADETFSAMVDLDSSRPVPTCFCCC